MFAAIRAAIIEKLNAEEVEFIQEAYRTDRSKVDGYPVAIVTPTDSEADYHQTAAASNRETYIFTVRLIYPFTEGQEEADIALEQAADEVLTIFRDRTALGAAADWVQPVPAVWGYVDRGAGTARVAEVKIRAVVYTGG